MRILTKYLAVVIFWIILSTGYSALLFLSKLNTLQNEQQTITLRDRSALALQIFESTHSTFRDKSQIKNTLFSIKARVHSNIVFWKVPKQIQSTLPPLLQNKLALLLPDTIPKKDSFVLKMPQNELILQFKKANSGNIWIAVALPTRSGYGFDDPVITKFILSTLLFLLLSGLTVYIISRSILRPVHEITEALNSAKSGKLIPIPDFIGSAEMRLLVFQFNRYAINLSALLNSQQKKEDSLAKKLQENNSKLVKLTDNLERVVARRTAELREKDAQLLQTGKLAGLGQLSAGIAHEINQPLNIIKLIVTGMMRQYSINKTLNIEEVTEELNTINQQTIRLQKIIGHMKSFARKRAHITFTEIDINDPINDCLLLIGRQLEDHNIHLKLNLEKNLPKINGDSIQVEQIIVNLINNARDAVEIKEVSLQKKGTRDFEKKISVHTYFLEQNICVKISDNGCGMADEIQQKIFEPFFSTKGQKGTGLGMSITYNLVKNLNGEISVSSKLDEGTIFTVSFPAAKTGKENKTVDFAT